MARGTSVQAPAIRRSNDPVAMGSHVQLRSASSSTIRRVPSPRVFGGSTHRLLTCAAANMRRVLAEAGNKNVTIRLFERANHPLMDAKTGGNAEIPSLKGTVPGLFDTLGAWVMTQLKPRR